MKSNFIFLVIFAFCFNRTISFQPYLTDNEEDGRIDDWKDQKISENDESVDDLISNMKNDLTDYDYKNSNYDSHMEDRDADRIKKYSKREAKTVKDIRSFSNADVELALSRLSDGELQVLEKLMENEVEASKVEKREIQQNKICSSKNGCINDDFDKSEDENYKKAFTYEHLPEENELKVRRYNRFKRYNRFGPLTREEILQARIDFLKDNYKRQSEIGKIENSFKPKERYKRDTTKDAIRNPYFNSLIGPRSRTKRELNDKLNGTKTGNPMDDPKSDEHIKLLEDSFPNPNPENSLDSDQSHIRVKRS